MGRTAFENLKVYQLAEGLADEVWNIVMKWEPFAKRTIGGQLVRAADSVGANIAEGVGRRAFQDNRRFVRIARGSLNETMHWLRRAYVRELLTTEQIQKLKSLMDELPPKLNAYLKSIGSSSPLREPSQPSNHGPLTTDNGPLTTDNGQPTCL
jgi:four helix bundle protein